MRMIRNGLSIEELGSGLQAGGRGGDPLGSFGSCPVVKGYFRFSMVMMAAPLLCGAALVIAYVILVVLTIPRLQAWAHSGVEEWLFDVRNMRRPATTDRILN